MRSACLLVLVLVASVACAPSVAPVAATDPAREMASWPPADATLQAASGAMSELRTLREQISTRTYRNDEPFLSVDAERAYVAPDRRYERMVGRSPVESVSGETVEIGARFFKRVGETGAWQELPMAETFHWPGREYSFAAARQVAYEGVGEVEGRPARILVLQHTGSAETRNAGWQFQTRLWIDPQTGFFLRRETRGTNEEPDLMTRKPQVQRYEGSWTYRDHNGAITIAEPAGAAAAP